MPYVVLFVIVIKTFIVSGIVRYLICLPRLYTRDTSLVITVSDDGFVSNCDMAPAGMILTISYTRVSLSMMIGGLMASFKMVNKISQYLAALRAFWGVNKWCHTFLTYLRPSRWLAHCLLINGRAIIIVSVSSFQPCAWKCISPLWTLYIYIYISTYDVKLGFQ